MAEKKVIRKLDADARAAVLAAQARRDATTHEPVKPAMQLGFVHNNVD
jgi:hypothetical protein